MRRASTTALFAILSAAVGVASAADNATVNAVWVDEDLSFTYVGFTSHYSCGGIRDKVAYVMQQLGARPDFKVTVAGCLNASSGPEIMPRVRVRAALPREATPTVLAELTRERSTRELAAHAQGKPAAVADEATAAFPAAWRMVTFEGTPSSAVQDGDCELMEQLIRQVLVPMGVREVKGSKLDCVPHQVPLNAVNVKLQVLAPTRAPPAKG